MFTEHDIEERLANGTMSIQEAELMRAYLKKTPKEREQSAVPRSKWHHMQQLGNTWYLGNQMGGFSTSPEDEK